MAMTAEDKLKQVHDQLVWLCRETEDKPVLEDDPGDELYELCRRVVALAEKTGRSIHVVGTQYRGFNGERRYGGSVTVFYEDGATKFGTGCYQADIDSAKDAIAAAMVLEEQAKNRTSEAAETDKNEPLPFER